MYAALVSGGAADEAVAMAWLQLWRAQEWQRQVGARPPGHWLCAGALLRKRLFLAIERSMFGDTNWIVGGRPEDVLARFIRNEVKLEFAISARCIASGEPARGTRTPFDIAWGRTDIVMRLTNFTVGRLRTVRRRLGITDQDSARGPTRCSLATGAH